MEQNPKYARVTSEHLKYPIMNWIFDAATQQDQIANSIASSIRNSDMSVMSMCERIGRRLTEEEVDAQVRRGWSYMKELCGEEQAIQIVKKSGTVVVVAAAVMLENLSRTTDPAELGRILDTVAFIPTLTTSIVDLMAEFNGTKADTIIPWITDVIPMTTRERTMLEERASGLDYTKKHMFN